MHFHLQQLLLAGIAVAASLPQRAQSCNGSPDLCDRLYSNVAYVGSHDSAFVGILPTQNQYISVADQLSLGVRFLQAQSHNKNGVIELCHTTCAEEDAGTLATYLASVKTFLDDNPNEVVTLLLTNGDSIAIADYGTVFTAAGLDTYAYAPSGTPALADWPTLGALISSGKRLIVFMDYHADRTKVDYILSEFTFIYETPYDTTDADFPECTIDRPSGGSATGRMGLVNHFLDVDINLFGNDILVPDATAASTTNSLSSITAQANLCLNEHGRLPNFILLDFINKGNAIAAQNQLNGL
ncbi:hypothetical protein CMQ_2623 [Grosmannia clavigera kw1407]|uniref:PLC-like phosphodiesterase n=1 Tax=Grosmannia clavigera (strain kw1407 / UAMH 11150) TaxID=655863 RepID=F0XHR6_GROCL|nr:uncharacterized protein CMQ_2623 [Grosmannia clavigera kw1407]EFX02694.1 hypothetical protein CMQ_2623 [Grosmannia clavigera kw1407]